MRVVISLTDSEMNYLIKEARGTGGFQSLLRELQTRLSGHDLELSLDDVEKIVRYVRGYRTGGFQGRLAGILSEIENLARVLRDLVE